SSRRRHTRFDCDWSSDVCSSDLSGTGKSTLLKILAGEEKSDGGIMSVRKGLKIGYLAQRDSFEDSSSTKVSEDKSGQGLTVRDEIGRASCRERVEGWVGGAAVNE